ncbi:MAG: hypothetical protein ABIR66_13115, partial [Saprospiraceae bacterium]
MFEILTESSTVLPTNYESYFGENIKIDKHYKSFTDKPVIGLVGLDKFADSVRGELFKLSNQLKECEIIDFGNLKAEHEIQLPV